MAATPLSSGLDKLSLETLPFDALDLLGSYLLPSELAKMCLVSRYFNDIFRPILYRLLRFGWPLKNKRERYDGQALLNLDFDKYLRSLDLDIFCRRGANGAWPIAMRKYARFPGPTVQGVALFLMCLCFRKQRSKLLRRLKSCSSLSSLSLTSVFPTRLYPEGAVRLHWFPSLVDGFKNLKSLSLFGAGFCDPSTASSLILASPGLRKLELCELNKHSRNVLAVSAEKITNFWTQVIRTICDRPFSSDTVGMEEDRRPFLSLTEFAVDEIANVDFSALTDLTALRTLTLHYANADIWTRSSEAPPSCAKRFLGATGLCSLRVHFFTKDTEALVHPLWLVQPPCLMSLKMSGRSSERISTLHQTVPNLPWRDLDLVGTALWPDAVPLKILGSEEYASTLERLSFSWFPQQGVSEVEF
jgi:hypothetical protein